MLFIAVQYLSLDINWATYKPEQKEEFLRDLEDLVKDGYHTFTADQKKSRKLGIILDAYEMIIVTRC